MDLYQDKKDLKNFRNIVTELQQDLKRIDLLLEYSTERTFPTLFLRRKNTLRQISTFELRIKAIKDELSSLSRV